MRTKILLAWLTLGVAGGWTQPAWAQSTGFAMGCSTIAGGSGACAGSGFTLKSTAGQCAVGTLAGQGYRVAGGFWPATQTEAGPPVQIAVSGGNVIVSWSARTSGFYLEHCTSLLQDHWVSNATPAFEFGEDKVVVEPANGHRCYRLRRD